MAGDGESPVRGVFAKERRIDRYEIREHLGRGAMGDVYRAVDTKLGRTVALKTVAAFRRGDKLTPEIRERFMREALAASRVDHRNVVQVFDFGVIDDGTPYLVMEFLRGRRLSDLLAGAPEPLPIDGVADIMLSVCAALHACHQVGIVHRDLKPANIFLCDTDTGWEVKVLDFGISRAPATDELTQDGQISIGTPHYFSPEQIDGDARPESDQYAVGVLLYVCLTGRLPYAGYQGARLLRAISEGRFDPPRSLRPDLPAELQAIIVRALHVSPSQRFDSIHSLGQQLWKFASPRGQGQWRAFYFQTPPAAFAASQTGLGEARPRIDPTASLAPVGARAAPVSQATVGPGAYAATKTAAAPALAEAAGLSHSDIAGESALSEARDGGAARSGGAGRWGIALVAAAAIGATVFAVRHASRSGRPAAPVTADVVVAPAAPAPPRSATSLPQVPSVAPAPPPPPPARAQAAAPTVKDSPPPAASPRKQAAKPHRRGSRN